MKYKAALFDLDGSDKRTESHHQIHQRKGDSQSGDGHRAHTAADEDAVDDIVDRNGHTGDDGRDGILEQQFAYRLHTQSHRVVAHRFGQLLRSGCRRIGGVAMLSTGKIHTTEDMQIIYKISENRRYVSVKSCNFAPATIPLPLADNSLRGRPTLRNFQ